LRLADVIVAMNSRSLFGGILLGGFVAGTIDVGAACLINGLGPVTILQAIASGVMGRASFHSGLRAAGLGLALQWAMSILIAAFFVLASRSLLWLRRQWVTAGVAYGVVIFLVMNYVVVPLSAVGHAPHFTALSFAENMLAMLLFGVIIAYFAHDSSVRSWRGR
jgi:uncharacterized membrane protein YagU involved in acid resistance